MFANTVLCILTLHLYTVAAQGECKDLRGRVIAHGLHYVPGPDTCTLCVCDNGFAKVCKAVLCSPPQDCRSFRVGSTCCEFICLDDVVKPIESAEANVRVAVAAAGIIFCCSVAAIICHIRRHKRRLPPHTEEQRSLTSIGYISGSMGFMGGGTCETAMSAWKPPNNYLPRGEAPPPYDEAVALCRPDGSRVTAETTFTRPHSTAVDSALRPVETFQYTSHGYCNLQRPMQQLLNNQSCFETPHQHHDAREPASMPHQALTTNVSLPSAIRLTGSLGAISQRGLLSVLQREPEHERPQNVPGFYSTTGNANALLHRTIPRISTGVDCTLLDSALVGFSRTDRSLHGEIRRSFHKPNEAVRHSALADTGRSMPRNLNLASSSDIRSIAPPVTAPTQDKVTVRATISGRPRAHSDDNNVSVDPKCTEIVNLVSSSAIPVSVVPAPPEVPLPPPANILPLTVDKPSCVCSYEESSAAGAEDTDDYRSECENCKSASSSRWVLEEGWDGEDNEGTQTLQRRAPVPVQPAPATATLPQPVTKQARAAVGPPSNWDNWFNTIPNSDTESETE